MSLFDKNVQLYDRWYNNHKELFLKEAEQERYFPATAVEVLWQSGE